MSRAKLSEELHKLLPGEKDKRFRAAVMLAYNGSSSIARGIKDQIDQENRLRKGLINSGTLTISSPTSATLDLFAWVIDYEIFQPGIITLSVIAPDASYPRIDVFHGNPDGQIIYAPGSIDAFGNSIFPDIPETNVILRQIIRNTDGTLVEIIIPQAAPFDHNGTANIQGGTPTERFHITRQQAEALQAANNPTEENPFATMGDLDGINGSGTPDYLPKFIEEKLIGDSQIIDNGTSVLIGTTNPVSGHKLRVSGGALNVTNWPSAAGAYDKLSLDFGENRGIGYDPDYNEIFIAGTTSVPVKIDTDAPTDSVVIDGAGVLLIGRQIHTPMDEKGSSGSGTVVLDWNESNIKTITLSGNCTLTFLNPKSGASYQIIIKQDATGGRTITWPSSIHWESKTIPNLTGTANSKDIVTLNFDGTNYNALIARNFGI